MPTISAMDPGLRYDDFDAEQAQRRARDQDYMMRQYLQNQQLAAQQSAEQNRLTAQERMFGGELADRAAGRQSAYGIAQLSQQPQMAALALQRQRYGDERSDTAGTRDFQNQLAQFRLRELQNITQPQAAGVPGADQSSRDARALRFGLLGIQAPTDPNEQAAEMARKIIAARMANADPSDIGALGQAYASGDLSKIPVAPKAAIEPEMLQEAITQASRKFGEKDAATFGFDPTENDVGDIIRQRDQLAAGYAAKLRLPIDQAKERANFVIEQQLLPNADRWGTGWIQRLREALRGGAPSGSVREPGGSEFIPELSGYNDIASMMRGGR